MVYGKILDRLDPHSDIGDLFAYFAGTPPEEVARREEIAK